MSENNNKSDLKKFFIKLLAITFSIIIIINVTYNLIFAEKFENINILLSLKNKESREIFKNKIRAEIKNGLEKDKILNAEAEDEGTLPPSSYNSIACIYI